MCVHQSTIMERCIEWACNIQNQGKDQFWYTNRWYDFRLDYQIIWFPSTPLRHSACNPVTPLTAGENSAAANRETGQKGVPARPFLDASEVIRLPLLSPSFAGALEREKTIKRHFLLAMSSHDFGSGLEGSAALSLSSTLCAIKVEFVPFPMYVAKKDTGGRQRCIWAALRASKPQQTPISSVR